MKKKLPITFIMMVLLLLYPAAGTQIDKIQGGLNGVSSASSIPVFSWKSLFNGGFQEEMNNYLLDSIPGKAFMIKIRNQILYSLFHVSPNSNVVIGDNNELFEPEYINYSLNITAQMSSEEIRELTEKLEKLQDLLNGAGREMYIFITPSKARYYGEDVPEAYKLCSKLSEDTALDYDNFIAEIKNTELNVFDSIAYIDEIKDDFEYPLWYSTGIHWSRVLGSTVAAKFNDYLREKSQYNLGQVSFSYEMTDEPLDPDADLYKTLNLFNQPDEQYYSVSVKLEEGEDKPNVFLRGGSFMGQSLYYLISAGLFGEDIHFENNYYFTDNYSAVHTLSGFNAYEELDLKQYLAESDILILEVNEEKLGTMSWGFIDYLLGHADWLEGE